MDPTDKAVVAATGRSHSLKILKIVLDGMPFFLCGKVCFVLSSLKHLGFKRLRLSAMKV
jgi:hypothetical protein